MIEAIPRGGVGEIDLIAGVTVNSNAALFGAIWKRMVKVFEGICRCRTPRGQPTPGRFTAARTIVDRILTTWESFVLRKEVCKGLWLYSYVHYFCVSPSPPMHLWKKDKDSVLQRETQREIQIPCLFETVRVSTVPPVWIVAIVGYQAARCAGF